MTTTNELDLVVQYAEQKGGGVDGQLVIDDVELTESRDNRARHGIGNDEPQHIEKGNKTYTFSTTTYLSENAAVAVRRTASGNAETKAVYIRDSGASGFKGKASGLIFNEISVSSSDGGDTTISIDADLTGVTWSGPASDTDPN